MVGNKVPIETVRDRTIDIAKGVAIIAIVLGHVLRGLGSAGLIDSTSGTYVMSDRALYIGHLTVFAFLSGLFVARGVDKDGAASYLRGRLGNFLYLYLVWQTLQVSVKLGTASLVNSAPDLAALYEIWKPEGQMWFLPWLIIATCLTVLMQPWKRTGVAWAGMLVIAMTSLASWGQGGSYIGVQGLSLIIFFFIGARIRFDRLSTVLAGMRGVHLIIVAWGSFAIYANVLLWTDGMPPTVDAPWTFTGVGFGLLASAAGVAGVLSISALFSRLSRGFGWLTFVGKRSLEIFLAHIIAASGARIVLETLGLQDAAFHIVAGVALGIIGPLILWFVLSRMGFVWLFQRPTAQQLFKSHIEAGPSHKVEASSES